MISNDWRNKTDRDLWQKRHFYLSCFVRCNKTIQSNVYEFIDHLISRDYQAPLDSLTAVDKEVMQYYQEYIDHKTQ